MRKLPLCQKLPRFSTSFARWRCPPCRARTC